MVKLPKWLPVLVFFFCFPTMAGAEAAPPPFAAQLGQNRLVIYPEACTLGGWFAIWKKAQWFYNGKHYEACWRVQRDQQGLSVKTVDSEGEVGSVPLTMFKAEQGV